MVSKYEGKQLIGKPTNDGFGIILIAIANELAEANRLKRKEIEYKYLKNQVDEAV